MRREEEEGSAKDDVDPCECAWSLYYHIVHKEQSGGELFSEVLIFLHFDAPSLLENGNFQIQVSSCSK